MIKGLHGCPACLLLLATSVDGCPRCVYLQAVGQLVLAAKAAHRTRAAFCDDLNAVADLLTAGAYRRAAAFHQGHLDARTDWRRLQSGEAGHWNEDTDRNRAAERWDRDNVDDNKLYLQPGDSAYSAAVRRGWVKRRQRHGPTGRRGGANGGQAITGR